MQKGFTLIELLLVVGMLGILLALTAPLGLNFYRSQLVEGAQSELLDVLFRAQYNAKLMKGDSRYGVAIDEANPGTLASFTMYQGNSSSTRNTDFPDEVYDQLSVLGFTTTGSDALADLDINFSKLAGTTTATGTITIFYGNNISPRAIFIDDLGNISATSTNN